MDNDQDLEIVSEILQGVTVVRGSFGSIYFRHLSQVEQREVISESKFFEKEAISKGLPSEKESLGEIIDQGMWSLEDESKIENLKQEIQGLKKLISQTFLPSKKKEILKKIEERERILFSTQSEREELIGLTSEKYSRNKIQKNIINKILFYDREFKKNVYDDLYINENLKEAELYRLQRDFFQKFQDSSISKAVLSDYFSMYLPFCEDVLGVFGKPLADLTSYQLKLISFARYFLNIFKNSQKDIPDNIAKDPELLVDFYQSQRSDSSRKDRSSEDGASTYFGATKEDIEAIKKEDENAVILSDEIKKKGGSLNMKQMMELHGL